MKFTYAALALAALAQAQSRADIPACALPCLDDAVTKDTKCSTSDFACICKNFDAVQADATPCVIQKCGTDVAINKVLPATQKLCAAAAAGGSGSSSAQSSPAQQSSSSAAQSSPAQQSTTAPQQTSSAASAPPSSAPAQTTSAAQTTPAGPVGTGTGVVPPPAGNKTTTGAPTAPTSGSSTILPGLALVAALCAFAL